ncbi:MAG: hypothetical protein ACI39F_03570, partial [Acutalibacteraceae bacterium]
WFERKNAERQGMVDTEFFEIDMTVKDLDVSDKIFNFLSCQNVRYNKDTLTVSQLISKLYEMVDLQKINNQQMNEIVDLIA